MPNSFATKILALSPKSRKKKMNEGDRENSKSIEFAAHLRKLDRRRMIFAIVKGPPTVLITKRELRFWLILKISLKKYLHDCQSLIGYP